jgi:outer membrane protein assembly factor BamB
VAQKRVYIGDEQGRALCFDSATGRELWRHELVGYISGCPVVAADQAIFISESGSAAGIGLDGAVRWKRDLGVRVTGQPSATQTQILVPTHQGVLVLRQADGQPDGRFVPPGSPGTVLASLTYRNFLCLYVGYAGTSFNNPPRTYAGYTGRVVLWAPKIPKPEPKK